MLHYTLLPEFTQFLETIYFKNQKNSALFPVQIEVLKHLHEKPLSDVCVEAPTGSGKTLAYLLPIINQMMKDGNCKIKMKLLRALIVVPNRELMAQVLNIARLLSPSLDINYADGFSTTFQNDLLNGFVNILVTTPGKLIDLLDQTPDLLCNLRWLVLDEADRLLYGPSEEWLHPVLRSLSYSDDHIVNMRRRRVVKMLFSATPTRDPAKLADVALSNPAHISVKRQISNSDSEISILGNLGEEQISSLEGASEEFYILPDTLKHQMAVCHGEDIKIATLAHLLISHEIAKTLIFTRSVDSTIQLKLLLQELCTKGGMRMSIESFSVGGSSANGQVERTNLLDRFANDQIDVLVCTDAAARGIDLINVGCVVNFDFPRHLKTFIHRAGRTARAGRPGVVLTLLEPRQVLPFRQMISPLFLRSIGDSSFQLDSDNHLSNFVQTIRPPKKAISDLKLVVRDCADHLSTK